MGENTNHIVIKVGEAMGLNLDETDISISHCLSAPSRNESYSSRLRSESKDRASSTNPIPKIILKFNRRETEEVFYSKRKHLRDKLSIDIGMDVPFHNRIYISESLSRNNKELFAKSLKFKMDKIWISCDKYIINPIRCI